MFEDDWLETYYEDKFGGDAAYTYIEQEEGMDELWGVFEDDE